MIMLRSRLFAFGLLLTMLIGSLPVAAQNDRQLTQEDDDKSLKRTALVIGNGEYTIARKLANPVNDATDMTKALTEVGFEVISGTNLSLKQMTDKVREFGDKLKANGGVGLFYYAGHGVQVNNRNYLIPVEADVSREDEIDFAALNFEIVLRKMATANNGLNIVILDACRNNPFARSWSRDASDGGLAQISAPTGTFIAYATSPDKTASDGTGRNGLYTAELLKYIKQPNLTIEEAFKNVLISVKNTSGGKQVPWTSSSFSGDFYFKAEKSKAVVTNPKSPTGIELVYIPAGDFMMGSDDAEIDEAVFERKKYYNDAKRSNFANETPKHKVAIKAGFWMGKFEVTQGQWQTVMGDNPSKFPECGANCPVEQVSWDDIQVFLKRLNSKDTQFEYSLPSEAQWEYAARGGTTTAFSFGDSLNSSQANFKGEYPYASTKGTYIGKTVKVGSYQPNAFGLYDMHGNVWEWVQDIYNSSYSNLPTDGSVNMSVGDSSVRVLRGGSWGNGGYGCRSAYRGGNAPADRSVNYGFRVVARAMSLPQPLVFYTHII